MTEQELIKQLKNLQNIQPEKEYARLSKTSILTSPRKPVRSWEMVGRGVLAESFTFGLSVVFVAIFFVLILGGAASVLRSVLLQNLPGVNTQTLISEADTIIKDIDIHLSEIEYYEVAAKQTSVALHEASINGPAHINPLLIEKEAEELDFENPTNKDIDKLLDQVSL